MIHDEGYAEVQDDVGGFALVPTWVFGVGLTPGEFIVYVALRSFASSKDGTCFPTQKTIAERAGLAEITVRKAVARFRELGIVHTEEIKRADGSVAGLRYFVPVVRPRPRRIDPPIPPDRPTDIPVSGDGSPGIEQEEQTKEQTREQTKEETPPAFGRARRPEGGDRFQEFWDVYAKKRSRPKAELKWKLALKRGGDADEIITAARRYASCFGPGKKEAQYQKDPSTWLHNECWNDEHLPEPTRITRSGPFKNHSQEDWEQAAGQLSLEPTDDGEDPWLKAL